MATDDPKMLFRIPAEVKAWLKSRADANRRTMNGEILTILEQAMQAQQNHLMPVAKKAAA